VTVTGLEVHAVISRVSASRAEAFMSSPPSTSHTTTAAVRLPRPEEFQIETFVAKIRMPRENPPSAAIVFPQRARRP
jgi:hypothetical protein